MLGQSLGHYRIVRRLGAGGMGEVFAAEDTRLKRQVALKVLPDHLASDPRRRRRFQREAEAIAALDHPNIVTIHSIESATVEPSEEGAGERPRPVHFLTMQLVEGSTLGEIIPPEGLPFERFRELALPLVDALAAAHHKGVVHRDLKPGNIMVGEDGRVRILDFGLAKLEQPSTEDDEAIDEEAPTHTLTRAGTVLGTTPYLSPEVAKGLTADARSDLFSLGIVFHEMLTGRRPFDGDTAAETISSILRDVPEPVSALRRDVPAELARIVSRLLEKRPGDRYQAAHELHEVLEMATREASSGTAARRAASGSASGAGQRSRSMPTPVKPSLAVVPFANLSDDPEEDYFAKGLWADINSDLVRISGLFLISQTTTQLYANKRVTPPQVGRELSVRYVLMGTVRKAGNRVRITAELVDTETDEPIWSDRFDGTLDDLFALQDQITEEIVSALDVQLAYGEGSRLTRRSIRDPQARTLFYRAMPLVFASRREELHEGQRLLAEAGLLEPRSPLPPVFAAWSHYWEARTGLADSPEASIAEATALAERALELEDPSGMAYMLKGTIHLLHGEHDQALAASEQALEHRPSCPWAYVLKGNVYNYTGKPAQAIDLARQAIRLTPLYPPLFPAVLATAHYLCEQPLEAVDAARGALELAPESLETQVILTAALAAAERADEASEAGRDVLRIDEDFSIEAFAKTQPYRNPAILDRLAANLEAAGLGAS